MAFMPWMVLYRSRPARGAWIETHPAALPSDDDRRRAPHGARGLKPQYAASKSANTMSRPARGAWIETAQRPAAPPASSVAPRMGRVD